MAWKNKEEQSAYQGMVIKRRRLEWLEKNGPCKLCGSWIDLEVDHIDRESKKHHAVWSWKEERRAEELKKCQVLCRKCHLAKTAKENSKPLIHGTRGAYRKGCRCRECQIVSAEYMRNFRKGLKSKGENANGQKN